MRADRGEEARASSDLRRPERLIEEKRSVMRVNWSFEFAGRVAAPAVFV
jgi:hypothetical protein